jgi:hypothetical protein
LAAEVASIQARHAACQDEEKTMGSMTHGNPVYNEANIRDRRPGFWPAEADMRSAGSMPNANEPNAERTASVGDDLNSYKIEHYAGESRPDMLSPDQDYIGYYRFETTLRVLFVSAVHHAERSDGQIKRLHINVNVSERRGEFRYLGERSGHFNEAEKRAIAEIFKAEFKRDRKLLFALHFPNARRDDEIDVGSFYNRTLWPAITPSRPSPLP